VAPAVAPPSTLAVTNDLDIAVNVYVVRGAAEEFVGQVGKKSTRVLPLQVAPGTAVALKAWRADGSRAYALAEMVILRASEWRVP
jgi:hypothetical protein